MRFLSFQIILIVFAINTFAQSPHGDDFDEDCSLCHDSESWEVNLSKVEFDHSTTSFNLIGLHIGVDCKSCHKSLEFSSASTDCKTCHTDIHQGTVGFDCENCHSPVSWAVKDIQYIHQLGRFPLLGAHKISDCAQCHTGYAELKFEPLSIDCYNCHSNDYATTQNPSHIQSNFSTNCEECHSINSFAWSASNFNHDFFPLVGGHSLPSCFSCHNQGGFTGLSTECYSCHQQDYESTQNPNHISAGFPTTCDACHNITAWVPASFDHNLTAFPLTGEHINADCSQCHSNGYSGTPTDCYSCHQSNYNNTTNPNHISAGFPTTCEDCHNTSGWQPASFDHDAQFFPIYSGKHNGKWNDCADCHTVQNNFSVFSCIDCHEHNRTDMDDKHQSVQGYAYASDACLACHPTGEENGAFNHALSGFVLIGEHLNVDCSQCHQTGYSNTSTSCVDCHLSNFNSSTNPNHQTLGISTDCASCHTPTPNWQPALFPQHSQYFELLGRHLDISTDCVSCHNGNYSTLNSECVSCHQLAYNASLNPNHQAAGLPLTCQDCHNSVSWIPSSFNHLNTGFELVGAHQPLQCSSCHNGIVSGLSNECLGCHQSEYNSAPEHLTQSYPTNCEMCHNSVSWDQVSFDHQNTNFILTGAHIETDCSSCHQSGYTGTPTDCYACHQSNYQQSSNPSHTALALPTSCESCHTTNPDWQPALFPDHDNYFQLLGAHLQINSCSDCHQGNYNNTPNSCMDCHSDNYSGTSDPPHQQLNFSSECLDCHNMNGWTPAIFDHNFYSISSEHSNVNCNECHSEPNYQPQCLSCHMDDFLDEHNLGDPTDCWNCHTTANWDTGPVRIERKIDL